MNAEASPRGTASWTSSALWALGLGGLFFLVYGGTNWITAWRTDVGTLYLPWERRIPFVPVLIIPYVSIDLFFVGAFFLCTTRRELHTLANRVIFAILLSGAAFLLVPLRFAFERPPVHGVLGAIFGALSAFDRPYNLVPSLHISLLCILRGVYRRHARGLLRLALEASFILIAISTVLTYQHHVLDVVAGAVVGMLAFLVFPGPRPGIHLIRSDPRGTRRRAMEVGARYAVGAVVLWLPAYAGWPWAALLAWPAVSLTSVAAAYFGAGPRLFGKSGGRFPLSTWLLLAPYLWGVQLSHLYYRRKHPAYAEIVPGIFFGRRLTRAESAKLVGLGVRAVLDLTAELTEPRPFRRLPYRNVQMLDLAVPTVSQLEEAVAFIQTHHPRGMVYVHCALGYSRSACVVAAYLLRGGLAETVGEAIQTIKAARPGIVVSEELISALHAFHARTPDRAVFRPTGTCEDPVTRRQVHAASGCSGGTAEK